MKIALIGYGKMGREIDKIAVGRGHQVILKLGRSEEGWDKLNEADVAIEFTQPESAIENINKCFDAGVPVVCGTTGWFDKLETVKKTVTDKKGGLLYASNFSLGVNLFFELNRQLAKLMKSFGDYEPQVEEIHHIEKKDAPSGTAITLAEDILKEVKSKAHWVLGKAENDDELSVLAKREPDVPGTHEICYSSDIDYISIKHVAHNRKGFALGAVLAAEFLNGKSGVYNMKDVLKLN